MPHNTFGSLQEFNVGPKKGKFYNLAALETAGVAKISRLPVSIRIVLESVLRNCDGVKVTEEHVRQLVTGSRRPIERTRYLSSWPESFCRFHGVPLLAIWRDATVADQMGQEREDDERWSSRPGSRPLVMSPLRHQDALA